MTKTFGAPAFWSLRGLLGATALGLLATASGQAFAADPIKIGVIAEAQAIAGASIPQAAQLAADEINANGWILWPPVRLMNEGAGSACASREDVVVARLDVRHFLRGDSRVMKRHAPVGPALEHGEVADLVGDGLQGSSSHRVAPRAW